MLLEFKLNNDGNKNRGCKNATMCLLLVLLWLNGLF